MNRVIHILQLAVLLTVVPQYAIAQAVDFDIPSVEAAIDDHKRLRTYLIARATLEQANEALHNLTAETAVEFDSIAVNLDKYYKAFDLIDMMLQAGKTVMNTKAAITDISDKLVKIKNLLVTYNNELASRGSIISSDTLIAGTIVRSAIQLYGQADDLGKNIMSMVSFFAPIPIDGTMQHLTLTTSNIINVLIDFNESVDAIRQTVNYTYYRLWKYITLRTHYWKPALWRARSFMEMAVDAYSHWRWVSHKAVENMGSSSSP